MVVTYCLITSNSDHEVRQHWPPVAGKALLAKFGYSIPVAGFFARPVLHDSGNVGNRLWNYFGGFGKTLRDMKRP